MTSPIEAAAEMLAKDPAGAEKQARALLARIPGDPRLKLIVASALRRQNQASDALALLVPLVTTYPNASRTRYEYGQALRQIGRDNEGRAQFDIAVTLDPGFLEAWRAIADADFAAGHHASEIRARATIARLEIGDEALGGAAEQVELGLIEQAEPYLRQYLQTAPNDVRALRLLATCNLNNRAFEQALVLLEHALALEPDSPLSRFALAHALFAYQDAERALRTLAPLEELDPDNPAYRNLRAGCLALLGDETGALILHANLAKRYSANARIAVNHGHALRTKGHRDRAIAEYRRAISLAPANSETWWSLANLKVGALSDADENTMRAMLKDPALADADRMRLSYALGRRLEDSGQAQESFQWYASGAYLARQRAAGSRIDHAQHAANVRREFTAEFFAERAGWGVPDNAPIFIVGLPRSGSTLVEQILASHPAVEGTMELPYIPTIAGRLAQDSDTPWAALDADTCYRLGEEYLARSAIHRRLGKAHFIDKMPNNFRHLGLIKLILPKARIVDVRRAPMASCFSGFKQLFAEGHEYSYDLDDLGHYYCHYLAIMRHFARVQPEGIHTLVYEQLIDATDSEIARLLDALGLPFAPSCLRFFENDRAVRTVSSEQVRQPIYRSGLDHWRQFEPWLDPLKAALGEAFTDWDQV